MRNRITRAARWVLLALAIGVLLAPAWGRGRTLTVCTEGCDYSSIQEAVAAARRGDLITVGPGTYQEDVFITEGITLRGAGADRTILEGTLTVSRVTYPVVISGFTVRGGRGVELRESSAVTLTDSVLTQSRGDGLLLVDSSATVQGVVIEGNSGRGVAISFDSRNVILSGNTVRGNAKGGIAVIRSAAMLSDNRITDNGGDGISISASTADLWGNIVQGNEGCGIRASGDSFLTGEATLEEVSGNRGGNLCDAAIVLDREPPPAPRSVTVEPPGWTNENAFTLSWEEPEELTPIVAYWFKLGSPPISPDDGTRREIAEKSLHLEAPGEGEQPVFLWLEDAAGNKDHRNRAQATLRLDQTPPTIEARPSRPPDANGWYNREVTVHFSCRDRLSDIASCTPPITVTEEGEDQLIQGEAVDKAGNRATAAIEISLDRTPPTGSLTINDGAEGTYSLTVTLRIEAQDNLSGVWEMRFSNDGQTWSEWEPFQEIRSDWDLSAYGGSEEEGTKTVWAQVKDKAGNISQPFSDEISFHPTILVPEDYSSLQEAIAAASEGARILIGPGTWEENLVIGKSLTLRGAGRDQTKIKAKEEGEPVIHIESDSEIEVVIEGLTVAEAKKASGIQIGGKATVSIRNSRISENGWYGIRMEGSSQATISGSEISGSYVGILMRDSSRATISGSQISGNHDGIWMLGSSQAAISGSEISGNREYGILMRDSSRATISGSQISGNGLLAVSRG